VKESGDVFKREVFDQLDRASLTFSRVAIPPTSRSA
jgi:hypothetical protein